jgi:hypothetical protein
MDQIRTRSLRAPLSVTGNNLARTLPEFSHTSERTFRENPDYFAAELTQTAAWLQLDQLLASIGVEARLSQMLAARILFIFLH